VQSKDNGKVERENFVLVIFPQSFGRQSAAQYYELQRSRYGAAFARDLKRVLQIVAAGRFARADRNVRHIDLPSAPSASVNRREIPVFLAR
jgi:hypothetical protein